MGVRFGKELYGNFTPAAAYFCMPQPAAATLQLQGRPKVLLGQSRPPANRTLNRHWSAGRAYRGVEVIVLKELGKMTP